MPMLHNEGLTTRNWTEYNFQVLRDDMFMLGRDGTVTGNRIAPVRSACAVLVSSQNQQRDWLYYMQQTISSEGFSGQAFSTFVPHTVRSNETKRCTDCHVSAEKDNNAWMATVLLQGTNFVNHLGRYAWLATGEGGLEAVTVAERDEPPAVLGSHLHKLAYPATFNKFVAEGRQLHEVDHHPGNVLDIQVRGEYAYAALGSGGFRVYDIANIDNKDFSERIVTAPVSPLGQRLYVKTGTLSPSRRPPHWAWILCARAGPRTKSSESIRCTAICMWPTPKKGSFWLARRPCSTGIRRTTS
jgi:hypothetical protein